MGDLMGKALWKLVENAQRFPRRGGRVLCVHGPSASTGLVRVRQNGPRGGGLRTGPPASSDCGRPVNDKCSHQHRRSTGRALELSRKDSNIRYLRHLGNSDIAKKRGGVQKIVFTGMKKVSDLPDNWRLFVMKRFVYVFRNPLADPL